MRAHLLVPGFLLALGSTLFACGDDGGTSTGGNSGSSSSSSGGPSSSSSGSTSATTSSGGTSSGSTSSGGTSSRGGSSSGSSSSSTTTSSSGSPGTTSYGSCVAPGTANSSDYQSVYTSWRDYFVKSSSACAGCLRVTRPDSGNDTVSEGIGYGMLLSAYAGDKTTFDGLWAYAQHFADANGLMNWQIGSGDNVVGTGGATDADEDIAFALVIASRMWGGNYNSQAVTQIGRIWDKEIDKTRGYAVSPGDSFGAGNDTTYTSYFAPSYYRVFAQVSGNADWSKAVDSSYTLLLNSINNANSNGKQPVGGLSAEQCKMTTGVAQGNDYGWNSGRIPWRIALDYCYFGDTRAKDYLTKSSDFFSKLGLDGFHQNMNTETGLPWSSTVPADATFVGPAVVGAMVSSSYQTFLDNGYTRVLTKLIYGDTTSTSSNRKYFGSSLAAISILTLSGKFVH